jgi:peroxiredoxin
MEAFMARTLSTMLELGTPAPDFRLQNTNPSCGGEMVSLSDFSDAKALLVAFICNHCPYVIHIRDEFVRFAKEYQSQGLAVVAISANDIATYPADGPDNMTNVSKQYGFTFPYLYDETQQVAQAYQAACTPDFFLFDAERKLFYRGQFDKSRPGNSEPINGQDLRAAVTAALAGEAAPLEQIPSMGCNIKWKTGNEPIYAVSG